MSPNGAGSDPDRLGWIWSGPAQPASPLLWTNGRPGRPVTEILQKRHMSNTCSFSHHLCQSHGGRGGREGEDVCHVPGVNSASLTCWTLEAAHLNTRRQLRRGGRRIWMWQFSHSFKSFSNITPLSPLQPPSSTYFKMWTCQNNTSVSNLMWLYISFLFLNQ